MLSGLGLAAVMMLLPFGVKADGGGGGEHTGGGGDLCEIDYRSHSVLALDWLRKVGFGILAMEEFHRLAPLLSVDPERSHTIDRYLILSPLRFSGSCMSTPLLLNGVEKSAVTEVVGRVGTKDFKFRTKVNRGLWWRASSAAKVTLACHEILVMAGIEKTGDYHICGQFELRLRQPLPVKNVSCSSFDPEVGGRARKEVLTIRVEKAEVGFAFVAELRDTSKASEEVFKILTQLDLRTWVPREVFRHRLASCAFGAIDPRVFRCDQGMGPIDGPVISQNRGISRDHLNAEAFATTIDLDQLPGFRAWLRKNTLEKTIPIEGRPGLFIDSYRFPVIQPRLASVSELRIDHRLEYSPKDSFRRDSSKFRVEQCGYELDSNEEPVPEME